MKTNLTFLTLTLLALSACSQKSSLTGGTSQTNIEDEEEPIEEELEEETIVPTPPEEPEPEPTPEPGVPAVRVGINFEDNYEGPGAHDFNDAVLCFEGNFNVTAERKIISTKVQTIKPSIYSGARCQQTLKIVINRDGTEVYNQERIAKADQTEEEKLVLDFQIGDVLEVTMIPVGPFPCADDKTRLHTETLYSEVKIDQCNDTGN